MYESGPAAALLADTLAEAAWRVPGALPTLRSPGSVPSGWLRAEHLALATLQRLHDPRWVAPQCAVWAAGGRREAFTTDLAAFAPMGTALVDALSDALADAVASGDAEVATGLTNAVVDMAAPTAARRAHRHLLAALAPVLRAAVLLAPRTARLALLHVGAADLADLRLLVARGWDRDAEAAVALARTAGDAGPLLAAIRRATAPDADTGRWLLSAALGAGPAVVELAPLVRPLLAAPDPAVRVAAAHLLLRAGDPGPAARAIADGPAHRRVSGSAARLAAELGDPATVAALRACDHPAAQLAVTEALLALGEPREECTERLLATPEWPTWLATRGYDEIVRICRDVLDPTAAPLLRHLAERDERVVTGGEASSAVWRDEVLVAALHAAAASG